MKFFSPGLWAVIPEAQKNRYKEQVQFANKYARIRNKIVCLCGNDKLIQIIEAESEDYSRRLAFMETTLEELLVGADYSKCETIEDYVIYRQRRKWNRYPGRKRPYSYNAKRQKYKYLYT